jgi:hypothetical protein
MGCYELAGTVGLTFSPQSLMWAGPASRTKAAAPSLAATLTDASVASGSRRVRWALLLSKTPSRG